VVPEVRLPGRRRLEGALVQLAQPAADLVDPRRILAGKERPIRDGRDLAGQLDGRRKVPGP
jgi:hypothetical protein